MLGDPRRTRDVRAKVQQIVDAGEDRFQVARMAAGDDPAFGVVKTLIVDYTIDGQHGHGQGHRSGDDRPGQRARRPSTSPTCTATPTGHLLLEAWKPGRYEIEPATGRTEVDRGFQLARAAGSDAGRGRWPSRRTRERLEKTTFDPLASWSEHPDPGVKYFSGTATYTRTFSVPSEMLGHGRRLYLDLGKVEVMAQVTLNGKDLGILWKPPFLVDVTDVARPGANALEVKVVNLWINRLIGDEQLAGGQPAQPQRHPQGVAAVAQRGQTQPDRAVHVHELAALEEGGCPCSLRPARPRQAPGDGTESSVD